MNHTLFHGSYTVLTEIKKIGLFGGVFASPSSDVAESHGEILHVVEPGNLLTNYALNYEVEGAWEVAVELCEGDEEKAAVIMTPGCYSGANDPNCDWGYQALRGELAATLGYDAVEMEDEHGTTWLCLPGCKISKYI